RTRHEKYKRNNTLYRSRTYWISSNHCQQTQTRSKGSPLDQPASCYNNQRCFPHELRLETDMQRMPEFLIGHNLLQTQARFCSVLHVDVIHGGGCRVAQHVKDGFSGHLAPPPASTISTSPARSGGGGGAAAAAAAASARVL
ncbi:unnamed protein product, partial [Ectocarpus sp. 12 AP-2014]